MSNSNQSQSYCTRCGAQAASANLFCVFCGERLEINPTAEEPLIQNKEGTSYYFDTSVRLKSHVGDKAYSETQYEDEDNIYSTKVADEWTSEFFGLLRRAISLLYSSSTVPQKVLLSSLAIATTYMLIAFTPFFIGFVLLVSLAFVLFRFKVRQERAERILGFIGRHKMFSGMLLLALILTIPVTIPFIGYGLLTLGKIALYLTIAAAVLAFIAFIIMGFIALAKAVGDDFNRMSDQDKWLTIGLLWLANEQKKRNDHQRR